MGRRVDELLSAEFESVVCACAFPTALCTLPLKSSERVQGLKNFALQFREPRETHNGEEVSWQPPVRKTKLHRFVSESFKTPNTGDDKPR